MSAFDDILAADAAFMLDPDMTPDVETITYYKRDGSAGRPIYATVDRGPGSQLPGAGQVMGCRVTVRNHATAGILASEIDGGDKISLDLMKTGTQIKLSIVKPGQDERWAVDAGVVGIYLR